MGDRRFDADATALIGLARIDQLDILSLLPTPIYVTVAAWEEVAGDAAKLGVAALLRARASGLLEVVEEGDAEAFPQLGQGEASTLSAAALAHRAVLVDERRVRLLIDTDPKLKESIRVATGIIGLMVPAKRRGRIAPSGFCSTNCCGRASGSALPLTARSFGKPANSDADQR